jgi:hypothetical protein
VIPIVILGGLVVGLALRWWAVLVVGIGWVVVIAFIQPTAVGAGALLGVANAFVGVLPAVALRRLIVSSIRTPGTLRAVDIDRRHRGT